MFPPAARAIVFDVVGTLVEPAPAVAEAYRAAALRHGIDHDVADIGGRFRTAWRRQEALDAAAFPPFGTMGGAYLSAARAVRQASWVRRSPVNLPR
jgi:beta-phosphoglucomutase-like phosphatase (HAD superfamily)